MNSLSGIRQLVQKICIGEINNTDQLFKAFVRLACEQFKYTIVFEYCAEEYDASHFKMVFFSLSLS